MLIGVECTMPRTGRCTLKGEMGIPLNRRLDAPHAQSLVADRLLYIP